MNTTDSTLAPKLATAIAKAIDAGETLTAEAISRVAVNVKTAGLMVTPLPEQEQPRVASEVQRHPSGVEVIANRWVVNVAQQRTPSPERSIERGRDDAEEDSRREAEAVS